MTASLGDYITVRQAAAHLAVGRNKIYQLIEAGEVEAIKLGPRTTRIPRDSLEAYVCRLRSGNTKTELGTSDGGKPAALAEFRQARRAVQMQTGS